MGGGSAPAPLSLRPDEGSDSVFISLPPGNRGFGGGKRDADALEECAKWGGKKNQIGSTSHPGSSSLLRLFYFLIIISFKHTQSPPNPLSTIPYRRAPWFVSVNGQRPVPAFPLFSPRHPNTHSAKRDTIHPLKSKRGRGWGPGSD